MRRGTTPTLILNVTGEFDWTMVTELQVTIRNNTSRVTKTKNQVVWDGERSRLLIQLSQADTTLLSGVCEVQMRYQVKSGNAFATNIPQIKFERSITSNIIGEDIVHVRVKEIETDVEVQSNEDETTIDIEHGEVIEGEPRISDIEVNGQIVPIVEGIVSISIPTDINELQGTEEVRQALATLNGQTTSLENSLEQLSNKVDENASVVSNELVKVNEELQTNKERWTRQGTTNFETNERIGVLEDSDEDHEKRLSKAEASIVEHSNTLSQQAQEISKKASQSALNRTNEALANKLEASDMATINGQKITEGGNIIVKGGEGGAKQISELTDGYRVSDLENNKADKGTSYTKSESDNKYLTEHQKLKTINGQSVVGEGNIIIEGGKGDVQSVSVNGGAKQTPDASGNINLEIEGAGLTPEQAAQLEKVATLEQKTSKFTPTLESGVKIGEVEDINGNKQNVYAPRGGEGGGATTITELEDGYRVARLEEDNYTPRVVNLFNKEDAIENENVNWSTGVFSEKEGRLRSDYIPVKEGQYIMCYGGKYQSGSSIVSAYCWYDGNRVRKQAGKNGFVQGELIVVPSDVEYIVFSNVVECKDTLMLLVSDRQFEMPKDYISFNEVAGDESRINIIGHTIDSIYEGVKKVSDNIYIPIVTSVFNKDTAEDGYTVNYVYGTLTEKSTHFVSDYIPVKEGQYITMLGGLGTYSNSNYCWFNVAQSAIKGATLWTQGEIKIVPANVSYLRFTNSLAYKDSVMILVSDREFKIPTDYMPYNTSIGGESRIVDVGSLENLQTTDKTSIVGAINELYALIGQLAKS